MKTLILIALLASGCATTYPPRKVYEVRPYRIVVDNPERIQALWALFDRPGNPDGFWCEDLRTMYLSWDKYDPTHPAFETLGHDTWHLKELGGAFHKEEF